MDNRTIGLITLLHRAEQTATAMFAGEKGDVDVTIGQALLLEVLVGLGSPSQRELSDHTGIDRSTMTEIVSRLKNKGFLARKKHQRDKRRYALEVSDSGHRVAHDAADVSERAFSKMLEALPPDQRRLFVEDLKAIVRHPVAFKGASGEQNSNTGRL